MSTLLRLTRVTSATGPLTKRVTLAADGTLKRTTAATLTNGTVEVLPVDGLPGLAGLIATLEPSQALMFGVLRDGASRGQIVTQQRLREFAQSQDGVPPETYARDKQAFDWDHGRPGVLMLDVDPDAWPEPLRAKMGSDLSLESVRAAMAGALPSLAKAPMLGLPSASSMIFNATTGARIRGLEGMRFYVAVANADEIPAIGLRLAERLLLHGYGHAFISRSGHVEVRTLVDLSVLQPNRLDFIGGALCDLPLEQRRGDPILWNPTASPIFGEAIPELGDEEKTAVAAARGAFLEGAAEEAARVRAAYRASRIAAGDHPESIDRALETQELLPDFPIVVTDGSVVTVRQILDDPDRFHEMTCHDPIEPSYRDDGRIARIYTDGPQPVIHSFAHGSRVFSLVDDPAQRVLQAQKVFETAPDVAAPTPSGTPPRVHMKSLADVQPTPIDWLLPGRVARQQVTMINGWPGEGKTSVVVDIVARMTKGELLPDKTAPPRPLRVLFLSTEDSESILHLRLHAAGADLDRVFTIPDTQLPSLTLPSHEGAWVPLLKQKEIDVVVVDPMKAFLDENLRDIAEQDARKFMLALRHIAEEANVAAICIRHPNKATAGGHSTAVSAASGSLGFTAAARIELLVGRMPDQDETRALAHVKNNLAKAPPALLFTIVSALVPVNEDETQDVAKIEWQGSNDSVMADDLLARRGSREERSKLEEAKDFLMNYLASGPVEHSAVRAAATRQGIARRTLERARLEVGWTTTVGNLRTGGKSIWGIEGQSPEDFKALEDLVPGVTAAPQAKGSSQTKRRTQQNAEPSSKEPPLQPANLSDLEEPSLAVTGARTPA